MAEDERDQSTWIGDLLDAEARGYEPDGERLRDLVSSRIAEEDGGRPGLSHRPRPARGLRSSGLRTRLNRAFSAGAGIAAVAAAVAIAVGVTTMLAVTSSGPTASGPDRAGAGAAGPHPSTAAVVPPSTATQAGRTPTPPGSSDSFTATERVDAASNPNWAQLDVVVTAKQPLAALEITIRVAECPGLDTTGSFDTGAFGSFASSRSTAADGSVSFVFGLAPGQTLAPGTVEFAVQFNHGATGWQPGPDTYRISARSAAAPGVAVTGGAY